MVHKQDEDLLKNSGKIWESKLRSYAGYAGKRAKSLEDNNRMTKSEIFTNLENQEKTPWRDTRKIRPLK